MDELELLSQLGLLTPEQRQQTERDARVQGLLSLGSALMQAGQGGGGRRVSTLQGLGMAAPAYMQGRQQAFDQTLQDILRQTQVQDLLRQRQEQEAAKRRQEQFQQALRGTIRQVPTEQSLMASQSNIDPSMLEGMTAGQVGQQAIAQGLPTRAAFDREAYMSALAEYAPEQYAQLMMKPEEDYTLSEGQVRMRGGKVIATGLPKQQEGTTDYQNYQTAKSEGYKGSFMQYQQDLRKAGAPKNVVNTNDPTAVSRELRDIGKDFSTELKNRGLTETADRYRALDTSVRSFVSGGNRAAIGAIIYNAAKIYDPSGAVQEGDKATILGNRSIPNGFKALAQKALEGGDMLPSEAIDLYTNITKIVQEKANLVEPIRRNYAADMDALRPGSGTRLINPFESINFGQAIGTTVRERK